MSPASKRELYLKRAEDGYIAEHIDVTGMSEYAITEKIFSLILALDTDRWFIHDTGRDGAARLR